MTDKGAKEKESSYRISDLLKISVSSHFCFPSLGHSSPVKLVKFDGPAAHCGLAP